MMENFDKAIEDCTTAITLDPKHTKVSNHQSLHLHSPSTAKPKHCLTTQLSSTIWPTQSKRSPRVWSSTRAMPTCWPCKQKFCHTTRKTRSSRKTRSRHLTGFSSGCTRTAPSSTSSSLHTLAQVIVASWQPTIFRRERQSFLFQKTWLCSRLTAIPKFPSTSVRLTTTVTLVRQLIYGTKVKKQTRFGDLIWTLCRRTPPTFRLITPRKKWSS